MSTIAIFLGILLAGLAVAALAVYAGLRLVRASRATVARSLAIAVLTSVVGVALSGTGLAMQHSARNEAELGTAALVSLGLTLAVLAVNLALIGWLGGTTLLRSFVVFLFLVLGGAAMLAMSQFVIKPYLVEAFLVPTNSMSPTIAGYHAIGECPHCAGVLFVPRTDPTYPHFRPEMDEDRMGTCTACGKFAKPKGDVSPRLGPDRIVANKLLTPRRWDVVVYRYPRDPSVKYVSRLVGLPGEKIHFDEDCVWINDKKTPLPEDVGKWIYQASFGDGRTTSFGALDQPFLLKDDECCLLGDFCWFASDSRDWGPAPIANIEGVVTMRYWPPDRWKMFR